MRISGVLAVAVAALCAGCGSEPTSESIASSLNGNWTIDYSIPGAAFSTTLLANGSSLSGTGDFVVEAGPGGTSTVEGSVDGDVVNLDFTLSEQFTGGVVTIRETFTGHFALGSLRGTMQLADRPDVPPVPTTFVRRLTRP